MSDRMSDKAPVQAWDPWAVKRARLFYIGLLLLPVFSVPIQYLTLFLLTTDRYPGPTFFLRNVLPVTVATIPYLALLFLVHPHPFVLRHGQQAFLLVALRWLAAIFLYTSCLYVPVNGFLWLFGSLWGLRQTNRRTCWLMNRRDKEKLQQLATDFAAGDGLRKGKEYRKLGIGPEAARRPTEHTEPDSSQVLVF